MKSTRDKMRSLSYMPPDDLSISAQLNRIFRQLSKSHSNLSGIGVGARVRRGERMPEVVVRFVVKKKLRKRGKLPAGETPLPEALPIWTSVLGQRMCVMVPTDISQQVTMRKTAFGIDGGQASSLAVWPGPGGTRMLGVVTAGHCLPAVGQTVRVGTLTGETRATVLARSDFRRDGLDIGIARLECPPEEVADVAEEAAPSLAVEDLVRLLGTDRNDKLVAPVRFWNDVAQGELKGLAYYWLYSGTASSRPFVLRDAVEVASEDSVFEEGLSGSPLAIQLPNGEPRMIAIQNFASPDGSLCLGTHFGVGIAWLRASRSDLALLKTFWSMRQIS